MASSVQSVYRKVLFKLKSVRVKDELIKKPLNFSSLYCLKAFGAFFVICIHCYDPWVVYPIIRTAVPFFFMISGYFLYRTNHGAALNKCIVALKKIVWITVYANIFYYLVFYIPFNLFPLHTLKSLARYIVIGDYLGGHLWYLNAYIETLIIVIISLKLNILSRLWWCIPLFVIAGLVFGKYEFLFPNIPNNLILSRNFLTFGIPCFGIGWLLKQYHSKLLRIVSSPVLIACIILIMSECEIWILRYVSGFLFGDYLLTTLPLAASILLIGVKYPSLGRNSLLEVIGKKYSLGIYIFHMFILSIFKTVNGEILGLPSITLPFIIFILTIIFVEIWERGSQNFFNTSNKRNHGIIQPKEKSVSL